MANMTGSITDKQRSLIQRKFEELSKSEHADKIGEELAAYEESLTKVMGGQSISKAEASELIEALLAAANTDAREGTTPHQRDLIAAARKVTNNNFLRSLVQQYGQKGYLSERQWAALDKAASSGQITVAVAAQTTTAAEPTPAPRVQAPEGVHIVLNDEGEPVVYKVKTSQTTGNRYAVQFHPEKSSDRWVLARGMVYVLNDSTVATAELAARFGQLYGICCFCGRELSDERSIVVGYGPDCAAQRGLPWGHVDQAQGVEVPTAEEVAPLFEVVAEGTYDAADDVLDFQAGDEDAHPLVAERLAEESAAFEAHQRAEEDAQLTLHLARSDWAILSEALRAYGAPEVADRLTEQVVEQSVDAF